MLSKLFLTSSLLLLKANQAFSCPDVYSTSQNGVGADLKLNADATVSTGFDATFYNYPWGNFLPMLNSEFVASRYSLNAISTSASEVTEPNFSYGGFPHSVSIYGLYNIDMTNILVELKGYFKGKFQFFFH